MDIKHVMKGHAYQNVPLGFEEAFDLGKYALEGCNGNDLARVQSIAALSALHTRATYAWTWNEADQARHGHELLPNSAAEQIAGVCAAILAHDIAESELGFLHPQVPFAMDNCGMGGDLIVTANVSTIAALIAAAAGIPMCKHGSPANADKGRHGSSDFIGMLGIDPLVSKEAMEACVETHSFGYTEALDTRYKRIHLQTHQVAQMSHMNDIIGPLTSPLAPEILTRRVVGVNHLIPPRVVAEACLILNRRGFANLGRAFFIRGFADQHQRHGMDELSVCPGGTQVAELSNGEIREFNLQAENFGLDPVCVESISPPDGMSKGEFSLRLLRGEVGGPALDMVLANAALLFVLAGKASTYREGYKLAREVHREGLAYQTAVAVSEALRVGVRAQVACS